MTEIFGTFKITVLIIQNLSDIKNIHFLEHNFYRLIFTHSDISKDVKSGLNGDEQLSINAYQYLTLLQTGLNWVKQGRIWSNRPVQSQMEPYVPFYQNF